MAIYRIYFSENDSIQLSGKQGPASLVEDVDFTRLVVAKPWGYEYLMYRNPLADVWCLFITGNDITSMHCHPHKRTGLVLLQGEAVFSTLNTSIHLRPGDGVMIDAGVFHSTRAEVPAGARLLEIETPPLKYDLIRLKDEYGRAGTSYEGRDCMRAVEDGCVRFGDPSAAGFVEKDVFDSCLCLRKIRRVYEDIDLQLLKRYETVIVLEGTIYARKGQRLHGVADIVSRSDYVNNLNSHVVSDLTLLLVNGTPPCAD